MTFVEQTYGVSIRYPANWYAYTHAMQGRHRGFDPVLVTSFEIVPQEYGRDFAIPSGGTALLVAFEGNDLAPGQALTEYVAQKLASIFYQPTGVVIEVGGKKFVQLSGETGIIWVTSHGSNVYSIFAYTENDKKQDDTALRIIASLTMLHDKPVFIPPDAVGLSANSGGVPLLDYSKDAPSAGVTTVPSMKLPWAAGTRNFNSGPHGGAAYWNCQALRSVSSMSGVDFGMPVGTEVLATAGGTVVYSGDAGGSIGKAVGIDHGGGFSTRYWHLNSIDQSIKVNVVVSQGRLLGTSGTAGSGAHLHLEFRNWPANTVYPAHGIGIDGYTIRAIIRTSDRQGFNYQGTMTRGGDTETPFKWCTTIPAKYWAGSSGTVFANATPDTAPVVSTNVKNTGGQPPAAPSNLRATPTDSTHIRVDWNDNSNNESGFKIYDGGTLVATVGANTTSYTVGGLAPGSYHCHHIYAFNNYGNSPWTDWACATTPTGGQPPAAPSNLRATPTDSTHIRVDWNDNSNNESGFKIYDGGTLVATVGANTTSYTVSGLAPGSYHCYHLYAYNTYGNSGWTDWACATTPSGPPAQEVIVDERGSGFSKGGSYWQDDWSRGYNGHMYWTCVNGNVVACWGEWRPNLPTARSYEVYAYIPDYHTNTNNARYEIHHRDGVTTVAKAQRPYSNAWVSLGTFNFNAGTSGYVRLTDATGETPSCGTHIGFDAIKWVPR
jgi:murein DD-endopeptidase MepM/ murein hydrolase activator NlpD